MKILVVIFIHFFKRKQNKPYQHLKYELSARDMNLLLKLLPFNHQDLKFNSKPTYKRLQWDGILLILALGSLDKADPGVCWPDSKTMHAC